MRFVLLVLVLIIICRMGSIINLSASRLVKTLPYDAEIEYLKGDWNCYIDTLYFPTTTTEIEVKQSYSSNFDWGVRASGFTVGVWRNTIYYYRAYQQDWSPSAVRVLYIGKGIVTVDGQQIQTYSPIPARMSLPIALFCWHNNSYAPHGNDNVTIYYFKVWEDDALVLDLIPVRVGTTGYMYDKVSGQLFGNEGTGNFILGPDK